MAEFNIDDIQEKIGYTTVRKQDFVKNETLYHCANAIGLNKYINKAYGFCRGD